MSASGPKADKITFTEGERSTYSVLCEKLNSGEWSMAKVGSFFKAKTASPEQCKLAVERFNLFRSEYNAPKIEKLKKENEVLLENLKVLEARKELIYQNRQQNDRDIEQIRSKLVGDIVASSQGDRPKQAPR